ncbi:NACHT, LRR and PYD domains-containing protein 1b allele 5-like [Mastacembelus armatus]|uniref:NACHT, LRR and PYD domains-containing protein 1b allele 5-like n=1 Tax=Mastacembelus armatus TaxID=205130 RepID=UPI000E4611F6|nr:NACHT, LRR and PYD domains-containing protein 1b allele 5-like [Mastacembelus armatus]
MNRTDLEEKLLQTSSEGEGPSRSLELVSCGSTMQDCSDWTKLEPEVNKADADETPTYSLQSGAGNFECSVSGLRWVCKNQVGFKYQFYSWEEHVERMESIQYMPAGPLIDIRVIAGKFDEVYLPHWIFIDDNPTVLDKFAVLHINDCGDVVEKVSEVTSSHVKLPEPIFSPRGVLVKIGFPLKINCRVLIYRTKTAFLTLHVYLIPSDPGLEQAIEKREVSYGCKVIIKPHPERSLQMHERFILTADLDDAEICPENLKLRYEKNSPNFFEMFIKNPERNFTLKLAQKKDLQPVWTCMIRQDEYHSTGHIQEKQSVAKHLSEPIQKAAAPTRVREMLLKVLENLKEEEFKQFKWYLQDSDIVSRIPRSRLEKTDMLDLVDLMLQTYGQQSLEVAQKVFKKINRNDLVLMLLDSSSGYEGVC